MIEIFATIMGVLMSIGYYPQAYRIYKNKSSGDISPVSFLIFGVGTLTWFVYGVYTKDLPVILGFSLGVIGSWLVFILSVIYKDT